jgi:cellulose synthase/poly-beta-1,6-N-acetylglucosamine synthase-like glycosyltransferase
MMNESLVLLRIIGGVLGFSVVLWSFARFRVHLFKRNEYLLTSLFGVALIAVAVYPDSINILAGMLSLENRQYGRLIALLVISSMLLWLLVIGLSSKGTQRSIQFDLLVRSLSMKSFFENQARESIKDITIIIPVFNEADNLQHILPLMPESIDGRQIGVLVVDDGSTDQSAEVAQKFGYAIAANPINRGGGAALRLGYDIAEAGGANVIVTMDGDGQHQPSEIERLVIPILREEADFVIGSRMLGKREKDSAVRWAGIHFFNFVINILAGTRITDCSSGFRAFRTDALRKTLLLQDQFHTAETIIDATRKGIIISEVPITIKRRYSGESKKGRNLNYGVSFAKTVFRTWLRPK